MAIAVVGAARVQFGADIIDFETGAHRVQSITEQVSDKFKELEKTVRTVGLVMTAAITVPFAAMVRAVDRGAGSFEGQMKRVEAALDNVSGEQLKALSDQARQLGPTVGKGATEAATGIEELGLAGLSTADILGGGLKATLDLAAAGMSDVAPAAGLVTDVMGQFKQTAADLPRVVQQVVGSMDASKFGFEDFQLAVAQGGGVAAAAGVSFGEFATAIAATSTQFSSGSDAGTSFKTYIQSLVPASDEAARVMKTLGIQFFDTDGRMKPLAEQAEVLRKTLGDLSDESKNEALKTIFGSDAARTAIALMEQGREGFQRYADVVAGGDVEGKIAKRLEGAEAAGNRVRVAWESVKIALGLDTGLLTITAAIKNAFAGFLEMIARASPAVHMIGAAFAGLASLMGPLIAIFATIGAHMLAYFVSGFGLVGKAIALIVSPVTTILQMLGEAGLMRVLGMVGARLAALLGPVGLAIGAFILMRDNILPVLGQIWDKLTTTLGPPLAAIIGKVGAIFSTLASGPAATALSALMGLLGGLADVLGVVVAGVLAIVGELLVRTLGAGVSVIGGFVGAVEGMVSAVSALLTGDFAGAWNALLGAVTSIMDGMVDAVVSMVPDLELPLRTAYEAAKAWLADGFGSVLTWVSEAVGSAVTYVASVFPNVVAAAKGVYEGVKGWLVDKFGGILSWVSSAAAFISDRFAEIKKNLGLGDAAAATAPAAPPAPKPVAAPPPTPKRSVDFDKDKKKKREKKGRNTTYDATNREQLHLQNELEAARLRGDRETEQRIQNRLDLEKQIEAYQRTGLTHEQARVLAQRDMTDLAAARAQAVAREIADEQQQVALDVAQLGNNAALEDSLSRQVELKRRIAFYYAQTRDLAEATRLAEADQAKVDAARLAVRERWFAEDAQDRELRLAQARGESEERIRLLQREIDIRERARELERQGMGADEAARRAATEWSEGEKARQTGVFRDTFKAGVQAAMGGDLKDWFQNWWRDRVAKGMEDALNSLADLISNLFSKAGQGAANSGGGILGALGGALGAVFGKSPSSGIGAINTTSWGEAGAVSLGFDSSNLPKFNTGGSFRVGGMSGIDRNVVSMKLSRGEMVDITKPGSEREAPPAVVQLAVEEGSLFRPVVRQEAGNVSVQTTRTKARADARAQSRRLR